MPDELFFKKSAKKEEKKEIKTEEIKEENNDAPLPSLNENNDNSAKIDQRLMAKIEKLSAESEANSEIRTIYDERFTRLDEQIGEIREMMLDREKDIEELEVKAMKASDLVEDVQPQKILAEVKRNDLKIDSVKAKLETFESTNETIMEELKKMKRNVEVFRGVDQIIEQSKELRNDLISSQKIKSDIERHSDKVESMYLEVSKKFDEYKKSKEDSKYLLEQFNMIQKQLNDIKIKQNQQIPLDQFNSLSRKIEVITQKDVMEKYDQINQVLEKTKDINNAIRELKKQKTLLQKEVMGMKKAKKKKKK